MCKRTTCLYIKLQCDTAAGGGKLILVTTVYVCVYVRESEKERERVCARMCVSVTCR